MVEEVRPQILILPDSSTYTGVQISTSNLPILEVFPPTAKDYDFDRTTKPPPILRTALTPFHEYRSHAPQGTRHLACVPKKIGTMLNLEEGTDEDREGWGLFVREVLCWKKTTLALGLIGTAALVFGIVWCRLKRGSVQDGFTVTGVLLAYGTILLGLLQVAVLQRSIKSL